MTQPDREAADNSTPTIDDANSRFEAAEVDPPSGTTSSDRDPLDRVAEEFVDRCRRGEFPSIAEYESRFPDQAEQVRKLLGAVAMMEQLRRGSKQARFMPERIGEFRVLRELGRGGMGVVYEAVQESLWRHVAVKAIHHTQLDMKRLQRFQREAQAVAQLHHTNIVPIFGVGEHEGIPYYAMQYIRGRGLDALLDSWRQDGTLPTAERWRLAARFASQAAGALDYAHEQGVLHRDIKPANLLIDEHDAVWITDFGLAKMVGHEELTASGDVIGTLRYLAPESLRGISEGRSDVYSLGLTLYEMITLRPPFGDLTPSELLHRVSEGRPVSPRQVDPTIPRDLETIVLKATARDLKDRYTTAGALALDLECFLDDRPILARRANFLERSWRWSRRNRGTAALVSLAAVSITAAAVGGWMGYAFKTLALVNQQIADRDKDQSVIELINLIDKLMDALFPESSEETDLAGLPLVQPLLAASDDPTTSRMFADPADQPDPGPGGPGPGGPGPGGPGPGPEGRMKFPPFGGPDRGPGGPPGDAGPGGPGDPFAPPGGFEGGPPGPDGGRPRGGPRGGMGGARDATQSQSRANLLESVLASYDRIAQSQANKSNDRLQSEAAWAYYKMGTLYERLGNRAKADQAFDRTLAIFDGLATNRPRNPAYFHRFIQVCSAVSPWQSDPAMRAAVAGRIKKMDALLAGLVAVSPNHLEYLRARLQLRARLALIHYQDGMNDFENEFRLALELANTLITLNPEQGYPHFDRADVLEAFADVREEQGMLPEARQLYDAALDDLDWVAADGLKSIAVASRMEGIADFFSRTGDEARSTEVQERADEVDPRPPLANRRKIDRPFGPRREWYGPPRDEGPPY